MTVFSLGARLHLDVSSSLALSLPQSFVVAKRRQKPAPSSEGAEAAPPHTTDFPQRKKCSNRFSVNAVTGRGYNPSVFSACETSRKASSPCTGEPRRLRRRALNLQKCEPQLSPLLAGCSHPSRCSAKAPHSATFPKGKAMRSVCLAPHGGAEVRALYTAPFAKAGNKKPGGAGLLL